MRNLDAELVKQIRDRAERRSLAAKVGNAILERTQRLKAEWHLCLEACHFRLKQRAEPLLVSRVTHVTQLCAKLSHMRVTQLIPPR